MLGTGSWNLSHDCCSHVPPRIMGCVWLQPLPHVDLSFQILGTGRLPLSVEDALKETT